LHGFFAQELLLSEYIAMPFNDSVVFFYSINITKKNMHKSGVTKRRRKID